jgi:hypothetical protein
MRSASVDLPWSMWATIEKLRMRCGGCIDNQVSCGSGSCAGGRAGAEDVRRA